jgi:hypothetical protein
MSDKIKVRQVYAGLIVGNDYKIISKGKDYIQIGYKGSGMYVPRWVFENE